LAGTISAHFHYYTLGVGMVLTMGRYIEFVSHT